MAQASPVSPGLEDWENPAVFGVNKRRAHVKLRSYRTEDAALRAYCFDDFKVSSSDPGPDGGLEIGSGTEAAPSDRLQMLSGAGQEWLFALYPRPGPVTESILRGERDAKLAPVSWTLVKDVVGGW